ncbi:MAG: GerW family sporulation protein [Bacillaceae bacterium]
MEHPIGQLLNISMGNLRDMIDVNTVIGDAIHTSSGTTIIPVSKVAFGFTAGGTEFSTANGDKKYPFGGGSGGGVSISPVGFLLINIDGVQFIHLHERTHLFDRMIDAVPQVIQKIKDMGTNTDMLNDPLPPEETLGVHSDTPV